MKVKISSLILNYNLYPRKQYDEYTLHRIQQALESGAALPPVIADEKSRMVVDGFHRIHVYKQLYGADHEIEVEYRNYPSIKKMFLDAVRINAVHGTPLSFDDRIHVATISGHMKIGLSSLSKALQVSPDHLKASNKDENIKIKAAVIHTPAPLEEKRTWHLSEHKKKSKSEVCLFYVRRLISAIENDYINLKNDTLFYEMKRLNILLKNLIDLKVN